MKNYLEQVKDDVRQWIEDNGDYYNLGDFKNEYEFAEYLNEQLWTDDSVTGNGSGSYTFNSIEAKNHVFNDTDTVVNALEEFCCDARTVAEKFINQKWEWLDVSARCYVLQEAIDEVVREIFEQNEETEEENE